MADGIFVTDQGSGSARIEVVLTGGSAGAAWNLSYTTMNGKSGAQVTTNVLTGTGSISLVTPIFAYGYFVWHLCIPSLNLNYSCYTPIIDQTVDSSHELILQAVAAQIRTLLIVPTSDQVMVKLLPLPAWMAESASRPADLIFPMVYVTPFGQESPQSVWNDADNVGYPVTVAYIASADEYEADAYRKAKLLVRRKINGILRTRRLPGTEAYLVNWQPRNIVVPEYLLNSMFVTIMSFSFQIRETIGT